MRRSLLIFFYLCSFSFAREWHPIDSSAPMEMEVFIVESFLNHSLLELKIPGFFSHPVSINGIEYRKVFHPDAPAFMQKGFPELPRINTTIAIVDDELMEVSVITAEFQEFQIGPIVPSRGAILRTLDRNQIPYEFDSFYETDQWFPAENVQLSKPFILRDFRGVHVQFQPFQYNPSTKTLRVTTSLTVSVKAGKKKGFNVKDRKLVRYKNRDFQDIYRQVFANFDFVESALNQGIEKPGNLVIITYDDFLKAVNPLKEWKIQKGIPTTLIPLSDIGGSSSEIKRYLKDLYDTDRLAYVILVGDAEQVPIIYGISGAASDPTYVMLDGDDYVPDVFISRLSASRYQQVESQINKFISYERDPAGGDWYFKATCVASNEGGNEPPDYLTDWERSEILRDMLLDYTYKEVDQIYDPNASHTELTDVFNEGRSILNYLGHGTGTSWRTTDFNWLDAYNLTNLEKLPFILDVSSLNGQWQGKTCLAEAFLRNPDGGAVGMFSSSVSPWWVPPTVMQQHVIELIVTERRYTMGGLTMHGAIHALEAYNGNIEGIAVVEEYNLFGDCTLPLRTSPPFVLNIIHDSVIPLDSKTFTVSSSIPGATVGLSHNGRLYGSGITDESGIASIEFLEKLEETGNILLTVTAQNAIPYVASITLTQPLSSYINFDSFVVNDSSGNADGSIDFGETVGIKLRVNNLGRLDAKEVLANVTTLDSNITMKKNTLYFGDVRLNEVVESTDEIVFFVSNRVVDGQVIHFEIEFTGETVKGHSFLFHDRFFISVQAPVLFVTGQTLRETGSDSVLSAGETIKLFITLKNEGAEKGSNVEVHLRELSDYIRVENEKTYFSSIPSNGGVVKNEIDPFLITAAENTPLGSEILFEVQVKAQHDYTTSASFIITVGENTFYSLDTPQEFGQKNINSIVKIPVSFSLADLDVQVDITHSYVEDIELSLESPSGTLIDLVSRVGGSGDDFKNTVFDDDADLPIIQGWPPFLGFFRPVNPLSTFNGENTSGDWILHVFDHLPSVDDGILNSWKLTVKGEGATQPCLKGDINEDGVVNMFDVVEAVKIILDKGQNATTFELCAVDYDNDGEIKIFDIVSMVNYILGISLIIEPPAGKATLVEHLKTISIESESQIGGVFFIIETDGEITPHSIEGMEIFVQNSNKEVALLLVNSGDVRITGKRLFSVTGQYRIKEMEVSDRLGNRMDTNTPSIPEEYTVHQNYPNPFNSETSILFDLKEGGEVSLLVYNLFGQKVKTLVNNEQTAGFHTVIWDGKDDNGNPVSTGLYICTLSINSFFQARKMVHLK